MTADERRRSWSARHQLDALGPLLLIWTITIVLLYVSAAQDEVPTERLFLDPSSLSGQPWYTGLLHEVGVLGWTVAATAAVGGAWLSALSQRRSSQWFLASGAALTGLMLTDEIMSFHAVVGPRLGIPKLVTIAGLLVASVVWFVGNWREIRRTRWLTLLSALGALATSVVLDYEGRGTDLHVFYEDAPKLLGIVGWATYFVFTVVDITRSVIRERADGDAPAA